MFTSLQFNKILTNLLVSPKQISAEKFPFFFKAISTKYIKNIFSLTYQFHRFLLLLFLLVNQSLKQKRLNFLLITSETSFIVEYTDFVFKQKKLNLNLTTISQAKHVYFNTNFDFVLFCGNVVKKNEFILKFFKSIQKPVLGLITYPSRIDYFDFYHLVENRQIELAYLVHIIFFYLNILVKRANSENGKFKIVKLKNAKFHQRNKKGKKITAGDYTITSKYYKSLHKFIKLRNAKAPIKLKPIIAKRNLNLSYKQPRKIAYLLKRLPKLRKKNFAKFKLFQKTARSNFVLFYKRWIASAMLKKKILPSRITGKWKKSKGLFFSSAFKILLLRFLRKKLLKLKKKEMTLAKTKTQQYIANLLKLKPRLTLLRNKKKRTFGNTPLRTSGRRQRKTPVRGRRDNKLPKFFRKNEKKKKN